MATMVMTITTRMKVMKRNKIHVAKQRREIRVSREVREVQMQTRTAPCSTTQAMSLPN
jgi:hypothetical protein